jgi:hypothetical protein
MTILVRDNNQVVFQFESGTYAQSSGASGTWLGLVTNHALTESENHFEIRYAGTSSRNFGQLVNGPRDYEGVITFHPQDFRMLGFALGSSQNISGTTNQHILSELNSDGRYAFTSGTTQLTNFPSFTIKDSKKGPADGQHYIRTVNGAVVDTYKLTATQGEPIMVEVNYKAQTLTLGSKATDIFNIYDTDSTRPYVWSDVTFQLPSGTSMNEVNEIVYTLENNVENRHYVNGSKVAQAMIPTIRNHTIELKLDANSTWYKTFSDFYQNGSVFNSQLLLIQNASTEYGAITFSGCEITALSTPTEIEGIDEVSVTIRPQTVTATGSDAVRLYNPF